MQNNLSVQVKVLRASNFDSVPLSTVSAQGRAGQQKVTWSHVSAASFKFISRPTRHVPINYLNLQGKIFLSMKRYNLKFWGSYGMAGCSKAALRGSCGAASHPGASATERSHLHPGMSICFRYQQSGNVRIFLYIPLFSTEQFWNTKGHQTQIDNDACGYLKQLFPTQLLIMLLAICISSL